MTEPRRGSKRASRRRRLPAAVAAAVVLAGLMTAAAPAQLPTTDDPRVGLSAGLFDAGTAQLGMELIHTQPKPAGFHNPANPGDFGVVNSDAAFQGNYAFVGNFNGFNIYDISNPSAPVLTTSVVCPGGQGDVSIYGNLLFMSVEETRGRIDCGTGGSTTSTRFRGVRIFDVSDIANPVQVGGVQTCRGSHTHTLVEAPQDPAHVYIYVSGTAGVRSAAELPGCTNPSSSNQASAYLDAEGNPIYTSRFLVEVIKVPLAAPQDAAIVNEARLMADPVTGSPAGLWPGGNHGPGTQSTAATDACHDITVFEAMQMAAGACEGNGLLIDISDPANPVRTDEVIDTNFAYWHGATFSNDGSKVVFTDEWGGGTSARCRSNDLLAWGGNAIFEIVDGKMEFRSYQKLPVVQTNQENCVSHLPSVVPVPGRDIWVQAWYQGGATVVDWTDAANPQEIGYYDRGPISATNLVLGGLWLTYWYNGAIYGSEIARGFDVYGLTPTDELSANEIAAANEVSFSRLNVQTQPQYVNAPSFAVARAYRDQLERSGALDADQLAEVDKFLDRAERFQTGPQAEAAKASLYALAQQLKHDERYASLVEVLIALSQ